MTSTMTDMRNTIIKELDILRRISVTEDAGIFKARSYAAAIKAIQALPPIYTVADIPPPQKGDGLGKEIRIKMEKIITTGSLNISEEVRGTVDSLEAFQNIYGVGPKKAMDLIKGGYRTIADLRAATTKDPKFFNKNQMVGLKYYDELLERIPRAEMDEHAAMLMACKPAALEGVIVGSYRRGQPNSGDIDMLLTCKQGADAGKWLQEFIAALKAKGYMKEILAQGDTKCLAISQLPGCKARRLDLLITPPDEFGCAVVYFTGSDGFNVRMRQHALDRGFTLNEHALTQVSSGKKVTGIKTERDVFTVLKLQWKEPTERTGPEAVLMK